jgi:zinc protease
MQFKLLNNLSRSASLLSVAIALGISTPAFAETMAAETTAKEAPAKTNAWGQSIAEIAPDPTVILGTLPNGMKYAIKPNATPKGGASVRFAVNVGFAAEADDEEGLAHFLEHMAFNGSTNIPEGELVKRLERLGLAFGADTNASTTVHETVYKLDAPKADAETMEAVLSIMRETASELTFSPAAVDRERGIVLSEKLTRNDAGRRHLAHWLKASMPETPVGDRLKGGSDVVLKNAPAERLKQFYRKHYRPEKATLVVVGDIDPLTIEEQIKARFSNWNATGPAGTMDMGQVNPDAPASISNFVDPAATVQVKFTRMLPYTRTANSLSDQKRQYLQAIASILTTKRFSAFATAADTKVLGGAGQYEDLFQASKLVGTVMIAKGDDWQSALSYSEQGLRQALVYGFTTDEVARVHATLAAALINAAQQKDGAASADLAENLVKSAHEGAVFTTPATDLAIYNKLLPELTADNVNAALRDMWGSGPTTIHISTKSAIADPQTEVAALMAESAKTAVVAPIDLVVKPFAYDNFGKPGKIASDTMIADLGIRTVRFANGALLNIKKTAFEPGKVTLALRAGSGKAAMPADKPGMSLLFNILSPADGLQAHSIDELSKILAGKTVSLGLTVEGDSFTKSVVTTPADLALQMKLFAATLTDFGYRAETQAQWPGVAQILATQFTANPSAVAQNLLPNLLAGGDHRMGIADPSALAARNMDELKAAIDEDLKNGPIEIALIGDVDEKAAIDSFARTFGALPKRGKAKPVGQTVAFTADRTPRVLIHNGANDQGAIAFAWPTTDDSNQKDQLTRGLLGNIFGLKLLEVVREKLGATYSPAPLMEASDIYPGYGYVGSWMVAEPDKMDDVRDAVTAIVADLRDNPVSDDMLLRARKPNVERFIRQDQENGGWAFVASVAQSKPDRLDRRRKRIAILEAITAADIQKAAQTYLTEEAKLEVRILSKEMAGETAP